MQSNKTISFRIGADVRTSFICPKWCARVGKVIDKDLESNQYLIQFIPIERGKILQSDWVHAQYLSLRKV